MLDMGFPETEARAALEAARGNTDLAVEFLMNGIPEQALSSISQQRQPSSAQPVAPSASGPLAALRNRADFYEIRARIQSNPGALSGELERIGREDPTLLAAIHANQELFLTLMNDTSPAPTQSILPGGSQVGLSPNEQAAQMLQLIGSLPENERDRLGQAMGLTGEQLQQFSQIVNTLPPEQLQQLSAGFGGFGGAGGGGHQPQSHVVHLTAEEVEAVNRLSELGFDQQDALAAYLSCDKNEALAANLLLEGWPGGGDPVDGDGGGFDGGPDDMYS